MKNLTVKDLIKLGRDLWKTRPLIWGEDGSYRLTNGLFLLCLGKEHLAEEVKNLLRLLPDNTGLGPQFSSVETQKMQEVTTRLLKVETDAIKVSLVQLGGYTVKIKTGKYMLVLLAGNKLTKPPIPMPLIVVTMQANYFTWFERFFGDNLDFSYSPSIGMVYALSDSVVKGVVMAIKFDQDEKRGLFEALNQLRRNS